MTNIYNDNQIIDNTSSLMLNQKYQQSTTASTQDLLELYNQMLNQRQYLANNNADHSLDNILETTDRHISMLRTIIPTTHTMETKTIPYPHYRPYINNGGTAPYIPLPNGNNSTNNGRPNTDNLLPNIDDIPTPPQSPDNRPNTPQVDQPNNNGNTPNNNSNSGNNQPNPNTNNGAIPPSTQPNRTTRNSPLQSGILSNIARAILGRKIRPNIIVADNYRNRFHNTIQELTSNSTPITQPNNTTISHKNLHPSTAAQHHHCDPCRKIVTNECNILRLILLYIALHPHCNRIQLLSTIAEERVQILSIVAQ